MAETLSAEIALVSTGGGGERKQCCADWMAVPASFFARISLRCVVACLRWTAAGLRADVVRWTPGRQFPEAMDRTDGDRADVIAVRTGSMLRSVQWE